MEDADLLENSCKNRMNLVAIKKIDPYAKEIIDSSAHVAFYIFNSKKNEWEKTDVEGALFVYNRNAEPFHSLFINNRLNTTSFVEPITYKLEIQSQPPFLLYRNERSRIRGFWFYNSEECDRISEIMNSLVNGSGVFEKKLKLKDASRSKTNSNIFNMLSKVGTDYSNINSLPSCNVLNFFASAKPVFCGFSKNHRSLPRSSLSVEQLEKLQRVQSPQEHHTLRNLTKMDMKTEHNELMNVDIYRLTPFEMESSSVENLFKSFHYEFSPANHNSEKYTEKPETQSKLGNYIQELLYKGKKNKHLIFDTTFDSGHKQPKVFEQLKSTKCNEKPAVNSNHLNYEQFVKAFNYLITNDDSFMHKLHEAYLISASVTLSSSDSKVVALSEF